MRIAQIGNLYQPVPAVEYGGTQRTIAQITAFQAALFGHDVTLYASSDSGIISFTKKIVEDLGLPFQTDTDKSKISIINKDGRIGHVRLEHAGFSSVGYNDQNEIKIHQALFARLVQDDLDNAYDVIHNHHRWFMANAIIPCGLLYKTITHQHNTTLEETYQQFGYPLICVSKSQADLMKEEYEANVFSVIHHGMDKGMHLPTVQHSGYLVWIGRFLHEKGAHRAIAIAKKAKIPLLIAGIIYDKKPESSQYFESDILPHLTVHDANFLNSISMLSPEEVKEKIKMSGLENGVENPVIFCGAVNEQQKQTLFGGAMATLFPISWPEPFGLVMIESMACGTPVIAYESLGNIHCGAVGEIIEDGISGYLVHSNDEEDAIAKSVEAVKRVSELNRTQVRYAFEANWTSEKTAFQINKAYQEIAFTNSNVSTSH